MMVDSTTALGNRLIFLIFSDSGITKHRITRQFYTIHFLFSSTRTFLLLHQFLYNKLYRFDSYKKMKAPIVIIGIGELGGEFARGFLRSGYPVYPITRQMNMTEVCAHIPQPVLVLITVQESELQSVLEQLPESWRDKIGLLQNELLPRDWQRHNLENPTVTVVWFEKKPAMPMVNILDTPVFGPHASQINEALQAINIPSRKLEDEEALLYELLRKSLYIFTVNICGLSCDCTVGELWDHYQPLARKVAEEIIGIQEWLTNRKLSPEKLIAGMVEGIEDCPDRKCRGRSAPARLKRILSYAEEGAINIPNIEEIAKFINTQNKN